jgi:hypothetical protein
LAKDKVIPEIALLRKFAAAYWPLKRSKAAVQAKKPLATFLDKEPESIQRWLTNRAHPIGLQLIKLRIFLEAAGYVPPALKRLKDTKPAAYKLAELLAFDILVPEEGRRMFDLNQANRVFTIAQTGQFLISERVEQISTLYEKNRELVLERRAVLPLPAKVRVAREIPAAPLTSHISSLVLSGEKLLTVLAHQCHVILPFVELLASDDCTVKDRNEFRDMMEVGNVLRLSDALNKLVGETARKQIIAGQGER